MRIATGTTLVLIVLLSNVVGCRRVRYPEWETRAERISATEARQLSQRGAELYLLEPRTLERVRESFNQLWKAALRGPQSYDTVWKAARSACWISGRAKDEEHRRELARHAMAAAHHAISIEPERVEGYYYRALATGRWAEVNRTYGLDAVKKMIADCQKAIDLDEGFDHAGPHRLSGILYVRVPGPPVSLGSLRKARKHLSRAIELFPEFPENFLYLSEANYEDERYEEALEQARRVLEAPRPSTNQTEYEKWCLEAEYLMERILAELEEP